MADISHEGTSDLEDPNLKTCCGLVVGAPGQVNIKDVKGTDERYEHFYTDTGHTKITCEACILLKFAENSKNESPK